MTAKQKEKNIIGPIIKKKLKEKHLSEKEFAQLCNVTPITMTRYINGDRVPNYHVVRKMAYHLNMPVDTLLDMDSIIIEQLVDVNVQG